MKKAYKFALDLDWDLISLISQIDRFDSAWSSLERIERGNLKRLKTFATIQSVGASTRIEGSKLTNDAIEVLLSNVKINKLEERDSQEVVGYYETLDLVINSYNDIELTEGNIKNLHNVLMKYNIKDEWHKGDYKKLCNAVEATYPDGTKKIIFQTTEAGMPTNEAMASLLRWYKNETTIHQLVKISILTYEILSIHPFQDGNGRLSRLLTTLLLLQSGYVWIQYISFEHEIENQKDEYYRVLQACQKNRPNENITSWIKFFLTALFNVYKKLEAKLSYKNLHDQLTPKEKSIITYIGAKSGCKSSDIADFLNIPQPTIKRILPTLLSKNLIKKYGKGPGTNYSLI
jgi:Fic family protein